MPQTNSNQTPYESVERLVTVEMRPHNMVNGLIADLYRTARADKGPIARDVATEILTAKPKRVAITTGIVFGDHLPHGEIDGPIGSVVLARAIEMLGTRVDLLVEDEMVQLVGRLTSKLSLEADVRSTSNLSEAEVIRWADDYDMAVAIEKLGKGADGQRHSIVATPLPPGDDYIDAFFQAMLERGKPTVGIGDGGNEIGFGNIYEHVVAVAPRGHDMATVAKTKYLFPAAVSNFGAYALCAALALATEQPHLLIDGQTVVGLIEDAVAEGCLDGGTVDPSFIGDDGIPGASVAAVVTILNTIVGQWFTTFERHF